MHPSCHEYCKGGSPERDGVVRCYPAGAKKDTISTNLSLMDFFPEEYIDYFDGFDTECSKKWRQVWLHVTINNQGEMSLPIYDYCRHLSHLEESSSIWKETKMVLDPLAFHKVPTGLMGF
jgi:hypothetical protein